MSETVMTAYIRKVKQGTIKWLEVSQTRTWPDQNFSISGRLIFNDFEGAKLASHMDGFDIRIDSLQGNFAVKNVSCIDIDDSPIGLMKAGIRYRFTAERMIQIYE